MTPRLPLLGITMGDPAGVGPEITAKALATPEVGSMCRPVVIGDRSVMDATLALLRSPLRLHAVSQPAECRFEPGTLECLDLANVDAATLPRSQVSAGAGRAAYAYIEKAVRLCQSGEIDGMVTAPVNKEALAAAGVQHSGHTEILAKLSSTKDFAMLLMGRELKVIHVTTHVALRRVPDLCTEDRVLRVIRLAQQTMNGLGVARPRIAVCGLNPHAGEDGLFGDEEARVLAPAAKALGATGPLSADTVFVRAMRGEFDAVLAPYHDVGMTAIKVAAFGRGVNVTLGLPFPRTSPDHGTALDIAGTGKADASSMIEALRLAVTLATRKA